MSDDPVIDTSRLDGYLRSRHRVEVLNSAWKPALAGAAGAIAIIGAVVVGVWVAGPRFSYRTIEVPRIVERDLPINNPVPRDKPFDVPVPRFVQTATPSPTPRSPEEKRFVDSEGWKGSIIHGRIVRPDGAGFILMTDAGEQGFYPAKTGANGRPELDPSVEDVVTQFIDDLGYCRKLPVGLYQCVALHGGHETIIPQRPITEQGRPT